MNPASRLSDHIVRKLRGLGSAAVIELEIFSNDDQNVTSNSLTIVGDIVTPDGVIENGILHAEAGKIVSIRNDGDVPPDAIDARGKWVLPGIVDGQTHTGSQLDREGLGLGSRAAAAGGVTTMVEMPYDARQTVYDLAAFQQKAAEVEAESVIDVALYGTIKKTGGLAELEPMIDAGACGFKVSTYETSPTRFARIPPYEMLEAFRIIAPSGLACGVHNENQEVIDHLIEEVRRKGKTSWQDHNYTRPPISEALAINEIYEIGVESGCRAHVVHCSIDRGFEICESYKALGYAVSIETCVQFLTFSNEDLETQGAGLRQGPPMRPLPERDKLWDRVRNWQVDFVSSDHVAWSPDKKNNDDFLSNMQGLPGLQTLLPAFYTGCVNNDLGIEYVAKLLSENVARHFCIYPQKGALRPGADADVVVLSREPAEFDEAICEGATDWSPYHGMEMAGQVESTWLRGELIWDGTAVVGSPGQGRFVRPPKNA